MTEQGFNKLEDCTPPQPHFDDVQTVLSAQPVVPLERINAKVRHRRGWILAGAFAIAMMLGAASALFASYLRLRSVPATVPEAANEMPEQAIDPAPLAVAESVPSESPVLETVEEPSDTSVVPEKELPKESTVRRRVVARRTSDSDDLQHNEPKVNEDDDLQRIREAVLYDQWQERRARRVRRERRRAERYNHRDLSNLDEIFEGRQKRP